MARRPVLNVISLCGLLAITVRVEMTAAIGEECDTNTPNVSVSVKDSEMICPSDSITLRCVVNTTENTQTHFLLWKCSKESSERTVLCVPILDFDCPFGKVENVTGSCDCEDLRVSEATFTPNSTAARTLVCSDGTHEQEVSLLPKELHPPVLNYTMISGDKNHVNVHIEWTTPDSFKTDMEYQLSVKNDSHTVTQTTRDTHQSLNLSLGVHYTATVISQRCNGKLQSNLSHPLPLYFKEPPPSMQPESPKPPPSMQPESPRQTPAAVEPKTPKTSENSDIPVGAVVGGTLGGVVFLLVLVTVVVILLWKCFSQDKNKISEEIELLEWNNLDNEAVEDFCGIQLPENEKNEIVRVNDDNRRKSGVGGLCIDGNKTYYSCCEKYISMPGEVYTLHVIKERKEITLGGFGHIRGIAKGKGKSNGYYVVDSTQKKVLKFDSKWTPVRRTSSQSTAHGSVLTEPFGILVTEQYVFVCAYRNHQICIFNPRLSLCYRIKHDYLLSGPTDITFFQEKYFVTIKSAIIVFGIDFNTKRFTTKMIDSINTGNDEPEKFNSDLELRSICASDQYLYVAEGGRVGRLLCLKYDSEHNQLVYVNSISNCSPVVVVHDAGKVYYSQRTSDGSFSISKVTHNSSTNEMTSEEFLSIR